MNKPLNKSSKKRGLGKGLGALLGDDTQFDNNSLNVQLLSIHQLSPNPYQPRRIFDETAIAELADSIKQHGIIQPLAVRLANNATNSTEQYEIIAGERRFRGAKLAGLTEVPAVIHEISDSDSAVFALIENLQREDLSAIEKAHGIEQLINQFNLTHEACGKILGQSRSAISNTLRLLDLGQSVQDAIVDKRIDMGHARALLAVDHAEQYELLQKILLNGLSVRETENLIRQHNDEPSPRAKKNEFTKQTEIKLSEHLQTKVNISQRAGGSGKIILSFSDQITLKKLIERLGLLEKDE